MSSKPALLSIIFLSWLLFRPSSAGLSEEKQSLLDFLSQISQRGRHRRRSLNWSPATPVCTNWTGVACDNSQSHVVAVRLPAIGIYGPLPPNTISSLPSLQLLSLRSNYLTGPFPVDLLNITTLTSLHLQFNKFSGPLPDFFPASGSLNLSVLDLSFNGFSGGIPRSIANLKQLVSLSLANNSLSGEIPDVQLPSLKFLDLANNRLNGSIPPGFLRFPNSSFSGNDLARLLPVIPSSPAASPFPAQKSGGKKKLLGESEILGIAVGGFALVFIAVSILMLVVCSGRKERVIASGKKPKWEQSPEKAASAKQDEDNSLVFFEGCNFAFDLEDLLRASAEVLGKGTFGTAYKAVLEDAATVVVKRLKEVGVGKKEFEQVMGVVGVVKHENVAELRAYYYSKDEKLVVYDYYSRGSVSSLIHGKRGEDRTPLDWDTRLKIAIGAAKGIAHIHTENGGKLVHGNIKASNVFLNANSFGCVSDLGLSSLSTSPIIPRLSRTAGYRAPEIVDVRKSTQASDVYSFGVLVLELLTGKSPIQIIGGGDEVVHLVRWVQSVVREEWTAEVFDMELMRYPNIEEELVEMLQVGMACVVRMPEQRPKMEDVVRMIEDVRKFDTGNRPSPSESSSMTPVAAESSSGVS